MRHTPPECPALSAYPCLMAVRDTPEYGHNTYTEARLRLSLGSSALGDIQTPCYLPRKIAAAALNASAASACRPSARNTVARLVRLWARSERWRPGIALARSR